MPSANIYTSTSVLPYVYICKNITSGEFYIGYRCANKLPSDQDLPKYKTSSVYVKPRFHEFEWMILAEFFDKQSAYDFEQHLINTHWDDPLLLNKSCHHGKNRFVARSGYQMSDTTKCKLSISHQGKTASSETIESMSKAMAQKWEDVSYRDAQSKARTGQKRPENGIRLSQYNKTRVLSEESKMKMSKARKARQYNPETYAKIAQSNKDTWAKKKATLLNNPTMEPIDD